MSNLSAGAYVAPVFLEPQLMVTIPRTSRKTPFEPSRASSAIPRVRIRAGVLTSRIGHKGNTHLTASGLLMAKRVPNVSATKPRLVAPSTRACGTTAHVELLQRKRHDLWRERRSPTCRFRGSGRRAVRVERVRVDPFGGGYLHAAPSEATRRSTGFTPSPDTTWCCAPGRAETPPANRGLLGGKPAASEFGFSSSMSPRWRAHGCSWAP